MSDTPKTDEFERIMDLSKDQDELLNLCRELERENNRLLEHLKACKIEFGSREVANAIATHSVL